MIQLAIKPVMCLAVLYGFYLLALRNSRSLVFNRYYLMFSLLFALAIPMVNVGRLIDLPFSISIDRLLYSQAVTDGVPVPTEKGETVLPWQVTVVFIYLFVSLILFLRYASNILGIIGKARRCPAIDNADTRIILVGEKVLPYSFFRYIFVNKSDYEEGIVEDELLLHEQVHCRQLHTLDVLIVELLKVLFWFNPFIWLFGRSVRLNHEYLADSSVLNLFSAGDYQNTLLNVVFRNNSIYLASHFNYSSVKKRLIMMEKTKPDRRVLRIIVTIPLFLFLGLVFANAQDSKQAHKAKAKQTDTTAIPPDQMKVMIKDGKTYVITPDGKMTEVTGDMVPPPPPPPPPPGSEQKDQADSRESQQTTLEQLEAGDRLAPPPPPPPPGGDMKEAEMKAKQKEYEKQQQELNAKQKEWEKQKEQELKAKQLEMEKQKAEELKAKQKQQ